MVFIRPYRIGCTEAHADATACRRWEEINEVIEGLLFEATGISKHESSISHLINAIRGEA